MRMFAVIKKYSFGSTVLALFIFRGDAENYIKERMIENIPSGLLDFNKISETLEIECNCYIEPLEVELGGEE